MGQSRKQDSAGGGLVLVFVALLAAFVAASVAAPLMLVAHWIYRERKASAFSQIDDPSVLLPSQQEKDHIRQLSSRRDEATAHLMQHRDANSDLSMRQDGAYDQRSRRGKEANLKAAELNEERNQAVAAKARAESLVNSRIEAYCTAMANQNGARWAVAAFCVAMAVCFILNFDWIVWLGSAAAAIGFAENRTYHLLIGSSFVALLVAIIVHLVAAARTRSRILGTLS